MNDLEMVTSKICSAREILDSVIDAHGEDRHEKVETLLYAVDEYLQYYLQEFDEKFKKAWKETVVACKESQKELFEAAIAERDYYEGGDYDAAGAKFPRVCDKNDPSPECKKDWSDFWEECYYPEEYESHDPDDYKNCPVPPWGRGDSESRYPEPNQKQYTEEELDAMCDAAVKQEEKDKCREYNLREAEYYNQRAKLDAEVAAIKAAGGYEWTPDSEVSRNDETRLKYEDGWVYESPDGGKTVTKRRVGSLEKTIVKADGYSTSEPSKKWILPVEEVKDEDTHENIYCVTFPDDLLEAADLKEGDDVEWVDKGDGSYLLRKVARPLRMDEC
jgi:hypothetical protein